MPQGLFSRHEHRGLRDFSLHLFVLNGFLPVLGSLSAHRALLHRPQTGTCLQTCPPYTSMGQCIYCISSGAAQCICFVLMSGMTLHRPLFNQMGISGSLLGDVCAGTYPCVEFLCHSMQFFLLQFF